MVVYQVSLNSRRPKIAKRMPKAAGKMSIYGDTHLFVNCAYLIQSIRSTGWKSDVTIQRKFGSLLNDGPPTFVAAMKHAIKLKPKDASPSIALANSMTRPSPKAMPASISSHISLATEATKG
jgi:hypothetical protein